MKTSDAQKHRINERLKDYWQQIRRGNGLPFEADVSMEALKDIWDYCFLVSVKDGKFSYSYLGASLIEAYGDDVTGKEITETLLYPHPESLLSTFRKVAQSAQPGDDESAFKNSLGVMVKYRSCVLPLAAVGQENKVAFLLGGMKWKAY